MVVRMWTRQTIMQKTRTSCSSSSLRLCTTKLSGSHSLELPTGCRYARAMLSVTPSLAIDENELRETFIRASGPGGQNVNKVATAVQLRWDVRNSASLPDAIRERLLRLAAPRITAEGVLIIEARRYRTQEQNRQDARGRLLALVRKAVDPPKPRRVTRPSRVAHMRRVENKRRRGQLKRLRRTSPDEK